MVRLRVWLVITAIGCLSWVAPLNVMTGPAEATEPAGRADFNGDGFVDLAIGAGAGGNGGEVHVLYGSPAGLAAVGNQLWSQDSPGIGGVAGFGDGFGSSLAAGDFNGDGFGDLAVGAEGESEVLLWAGAVNVIYGSAAGLTSAGSQFWTQNSRGIAGTLEEEDFFGRSLAVANFGKSGHDDLLVGVPGETVGASSSAGAVQVLYGSAGGLTSAGNKMWTQNSTGISSRAESRDSFGETVAAGDFGKSGYADVAVGSPKEAVGKVSDAGVVHVLFGSASGLTSSGSQMWSRNSRGVPGVAADGDWFGAALAAANFGKDTHSDLAVGVPNSPSPSGSGSGGGAVGLLYGSKSGLTSAGSQSWSQDSPRIEGATEEYDAFGDSLAAADLGYSTHADLVIGVQGEDVGAVQDSGGINVLYGSAAGLTSAGNQFWSSRSPGIKGGDVSEAELFGYSLAAGNFGKSGHADVAIGAPEVSVGGRARAGVVQVLHGSARGLTAAGNQLWSRETPDILGEARVLSLFGVALAASP